MPLLRACLLAALLVPAAARAQGPEWDYLLHCSGCHLENGSGIPPDVPDIREDIDLFLMSREGRAYLGRVPGVTDAPLDDERLARLLNWMVERFAAGDTPFEPFRAAEVAGFREHSLRDPLRYRDSLLETLRVAGPESE